MRNKCSCGNHLFNTTKEKEQKEGKTIINAEQHGKNSLCSSI